MLKPLISEKSISRTAEGKYTFLLESPMTKIAIGKLVAKFFNVDPIAVNTISKLGKKKRTGRVYGKRKDQHIAIVTLKKGQTIPGFDFPAEEKEDKPKEKANPKTKLIDEPVIKKDNQAVKKIGLPRTHKESK